MAYIGREPLGGEVILLNSIESQFNGVLTTFNLTRTVSGVTSAFYPVGSQQLLVSLGGVIQRPDPTGDTGFRISFNTIIFAVAPLAGASCFIISYGNLIDIGAPANNTVTTDKLVDGSVTPVKLSTGGPWWLTSGNVGIGTTNPTTKLHVKSNDASEAGVNNGFVTDALVGFYGGLRTTISAGNIIDTGIVHIKGQITDANAGSTGTHETGKLIFSGRRATGAQSIVSNETVWDYNNQTAGSKLSFWTAVTSNNGVTAPTRALTIDQGQNVGIGTTAPDVKFHVWAGQGKISARTKANTGTTLALSTTDASSRMELLFEHTASSYWRIQAVEQDVAYRPLVLQNDGGNVGIGITNPLTKLDVNGTIRGERYVGINSLTLNSYQTVNPSSNVFLYSPGNDRDSWVYLDSADTISNWGIYHRQIDSAVLDLPANSIGFIGGNTSTAQAYISLHTGNAYFRGSVGIGTTTPTYALHAKSTSSNAVAVLESTQGDSDNVQLRFKGTNGEKWAIGNNVATGGTGTNFDIFDLTAVTGRFRIDSNGNVGIGITNPGFRLEVNGSFAATTKSFLIPHPTKENYKLRHGSLEGPENGVYVRGRTSANIIELPDYWTGLVDEDSITVNLTPIGNRHIWVEEINNNKVYINSEDTIDCFYTVFAERKDVEKLIVEIEEN